MDTWKYFRTSLVLMVCIAPTDSPIIYIYMKPYLHIFLAVTDFKVNDTIYVLSINIKIRIELFRSNLFLREVQRIITPFDYIWSRILSIPTSQTTDTSYKY
jgi:hypothetical protein